MNEMAKRAQAELEKYRTVVKQIRYTEDRIVQIRSQIESTSKPPREIDIQYTGNPKGVEMLLCELVDLQNMYLEIAASGTRFCAKLEQRINRISGVPGLILQRRYIAGEMLADIAIDLDYSGRQAIRLQEIGLVEYSKMMED